MQNKIAKIQKRDGTIVEFNQSKITDAIFKAITATGQGDGKKSKRVSDRVAKILHRRFKKDEIPQVEQIQDIVEEVLILEGLVEVAKAYILYREQRRRIREAVKIVDESSEKIDSYLQELDWQVSENANMTFSLQGLNQYVGSYISKKYWLNKIYPQEVREAAANEDFHIHNLEILAPYCAGWDLYDLLMRGFGGVLGKLECKPAKHLRTAMNQLVNFLYTLQGETAGANAVSNFDTLLAPFIRYDNLNYLQVKQVMQEFLFGCMVPTRVGFQTPFLNVTLDINPPSFLAKQPVIIGGKPQKETYGEFRAEMDMFIRAFYEVLMEGDAKGRPFTFPIPTVSIGKDFNWENPVLEPLWEATAKYGVNYFSNFIQSDMSPEDARSMCCRLRLDNRELYKRGGGLFGSNPLTGSIGVVTVNMPRIGYLSKTKKEYLERLGNLMDLAKESLEIKRKALDNFIEKGLYPFSKNYLSSVKKMRSSYFGNHFSTIGLMGMNESLLNFIGEDIGSVRGRKFALEVLDFMRERMIKYQQDTGHLYNLEATPGEGTSYRQALADKERYPDIITAGTKDVPYYTNSSLPYSEEILVDGKLIKIGEFVEEHLEKDTTDHYTFSFYNGKIVKSKILGAIKHEPKAKLFSIKTKTGREIRVTGNHSVFWFNPENGKVEPKIVYDFKIGDSIIIFKGPLEISDFEFIKSSKIIDSPITKKEEPFVGFTQRNHSLVKQDIELDYNFGFLCGLNQSDGSVLNSDNPKRIAERVDFCFDNFKDGATATQSAVLMKTLTNAKPYIYSYPNYSLLQYYSKNLAWLFKSLKLHQKRVPEVVLRGPKECKIGYLDGFIVGDGYINIDDIKRYHYIAISQNQRETLSDISLLLASLGIYHTIAGPNCEGMYHIRISRQGLENLSKLSKLPDLKLSIEHIKTSLPCNYQIVEYLVKKYGQGKKWRVLNKIGSEDKYVGAEKIIEFCKKKGEDYIINLLENFLADTVIEIKGIEEPGFHYDISTQYENFYGRDGILCHNTQLPVNYTDDPFEALRLQDDLQKKYSGGTVLHLFLGERISDPEMAKNLVKKSFEKFHLPYITLTPTFSICPSHGYLDGEHFFCPRCTIKQPCEVYSRIVGYLRPVQQWHFGKKQEFKERKEFKIPKL